MAHEPRLSLGWFFLVVQFLDVLFCAFVLTVQALFAYVGLARG